VDIPTKDRLPGISRRRRARRTMRFSTEMPVRFHTRRSSAGGVATNICVGGAFVATLCSLAIGERMIVTFRFPGDAHPIDVLAEVRWARTFQDLDDQPAGVGLKFIDTPVRAALRALAPRANRTNET
jgi:hypothetical protein